MENYEKLQKIGNGNFGRILLVRRKSDGRVFIFFISILA